MMRSLCVLSVLLSGLAPLASAARFDIAAIGKIVRVSDPQISPDGRSIVIVVSRANYTDDRHDAELVLVDVATGAQQILTRDREKLASPRWAPDGHRLAFLAADSKGKSQIFVMPMAGGDALQATSSPTPVQQFAWNPAGDEIAFTAEEPRPKRTGEARFDDAFEVGDNDYLIREQPMPTRLWLVKPDGSGLRQLTWGTMTLPVSHPPSPPASPLEWSPDGKSIAYVRLESAYSGDGDKAKIELINLASGESRPLTGRSRHEGYPVFSPDGKQVAYWYPRDGLTKYGTSIYVSPVGGGEGRDVTRDIDRNIQRAIWMPDGNSLLVGANDHTSVGLWIQPIDGPARQLSLGEICPSSSFWVDVNVGRDGAIAFSGSAPLDPTELYYMASATSAPKRLTDFNHDIAALELGKRETIRWKGPDGFEDDGVLTYPPDFDPGHKYPLVLLIHGGPRYATRQAFSPMPQLFAAHGWVVFEPNYRGSDNLGNAFQSAIWNDAGDGPGRDVMSGVDLLEKRGFVDESRMAVSGWSYGGYMTTWLLGHYPVWKVAVAGAAVTDWIDQYALGDANVRRGAAFGGSPYTDPKRYQAYIDESPITYANKIKAPTLILSDVGDYRVTVTQSYKLFHVLRDNGVTTRFFAYPVGGHFPTDPVRQRDIDRRWVDWLAKYLNGGVQSAAAH
jgi:dipeptidyl aminopeptidase/acylaminoacyl peptidase